MLTFSKGIRKLCDLSSVSIKIWFVGCGRWNLLVKALLLKMIDDIRWLVFHWAFFICAKIWLWVFLLRRSSFELLSPFFFEPLCWINFFTSNLTVVSKRYFKLFMYERLPFNCLLCRKCRTIFLWYIFNYNVCNSDLIINFVGRWNKVSSWNPCKQMPSREWMAIWSFRNIINCIYAL